MNDLPDGISTIRVTENRLNMPQVTTETDVASLKRHLEGEPLGHETELVQKRVEQLVPDTTEQGWYIDKSRFDFHIDPVLNQSVGGQKLLHVSAGRHGDGGSVGHRPPADHRQPVPVTLQQLRQVQLYQPAERLEAAARAYSRT
ncbi:YjbH domain-containing protein [Enterobacter ludwigii]|uniref:YjbH domain-containing protein n=1 Tax=Enterobacter ludwigii TaxID=299767 RepID=UPI003D25A213